MSGLSRRQTLLLLGAGGVTSLAGCSEDENEPNTQSGGGETPGESGGENSAPEQEFDFSDQQPVSAPMRYSLPIGGLYSPVSRGPRTNPTVDWEHNLEEGIRSVLINDNAIHLFKQNTHDGSQIISHSGERLWNTDGYATPTFVLDDRVASFSFNYSGSGSIEIRDSETGALTTEEINAPPDDFGSRDTTIDPAWTQPNFDSEILIQTRYEAGTFSSSTRSYFSMWDRNEKEYISHTESEQTQLFIIATDGENVYGTDYSAENIYALDLESLEQTPVIEETQIAGSGDCPVGYANGRLYYYRDVSGGDPERVAVDVATGETVWEHQVPPAEQPPELNMCTTDDQYIYNTSTTLGGDSLVVLDQETGDVAWNRSGEVRCSTIGGDILYVGTQNGIILFDKHSGEEIDMIDTPYRVDNLVAFKDRLICLSTSIFTVVPQL
jgi:outer membrane protein assembly factor BamB